MTTILVAEDDPNIALGLQYDLTLEGYSVEVARDGETASKRARETAFDLIVLDIMLPRKDGFQVCRELRHAGVKAPILMLTAKTQEAEKVLGLELGADDYVTKPFSPRELAARIKAVLRRTPGESLERGPAQVTYGDFQMDFRRYTVTVAGQPVDLTPTEFRLLGALVREAGQVLSREQLIEKVLGSDFDGFDRTVDVHILNLRRKLGDDPSQPRYIKTIYGAGYKFEAGGNDP